jgi:hypothetical protein
MITSIKVKPAAVKRGTGETPMLPPLATKPKSWNLRRFHEEDLADKAGDMAKGIQQINADNQD